MSISFEHESLKDEIVRLLEQYAQVDAFHKEHEEFGEAVHSRNLRKIYNKLNDILDGNHKQYPKDIEKYRKEKTNLPNMDLHQMLHQMLNQQSEISKPNFDFRYNNTDSKHTLIIGGKETGKTSLVKKLITKSIDESNGIYSAIWVSNVKTRPFENSLFNFVYYNNSPDINMFEHISCLINEALKKGSTHVYVVFDDVKITSTESADEILKYMGALTYISNKIQGFITIPYPVGSLLLHKNTFKYIVAFKENQEIHQEKLYPLFNSVKENLFDSFKDTMANDLKNYGCLVKDKDSDSVFYYKNK